MDKLRKAKKILILGLGKEGQDTLFFLKKSFPDKEIGIADKNEDLKTILKDFNFKNSVKFHLGENYLKAIKEYDLIFKSPGISINIPEIKRALKQDKITSQLELFLDNCKGKIIGVTGTKGKGTCTYFIYQILKRANKEVVLGGNIGIPVLSLLPKIKKNTIVVLEMSSHQLAHLKKSPHISVFLNIFPAHLDYYTNFQQYLESKYPIAIFQNKKDIFIYNQDYEKLEKLSEKTKASRISFSIKNKSADCHISNNKIVYLGKTILTINPEKENPLKYLNFLPGIIIGKLLKIKNGTIRLAIDKYKSLPHRLEFVGNKNGVLFYNDSMATVPEATILAIDTLGDKINTLILGGYDSGLKYKNLAWKIKKTSIKNLIFFPPVGEKIYKELNLKKGERNCFFAKNMKEAIEFSFKNTGRGNICLLSPGAPSFGIFENYAQRGELFKKYIKSHS